MRTLVCAALAAAGLPAAAAAHHSFFGRFDTQRLVELEGDVTDVLWKNPHAYFTVRADDVAWEIETSSLTVLKRMGIDVGTIRVGDRIRIAANQPVGDKKEMYARHALLPDGRELLLNVGLTPRWAERSRAVGDESLLMARTGDPSRPELGIFRVWSSTFANAPVLFTDSFKPGFTVLNYPLTPAARRAVEAFDAVAGSRRLANNCTPKGMPWIMEQPYDLAFERDGNDILLKLEEFDVVRRIRLDWQGDRAAQPFTPHGFSTGVWAERTLVVTTTNLNSPNFKFEIPQSNEAEIVERFTASADGAKLDYEIVVNDPITFTAPVRMAKYWISLPNQALDAYNCGAPLSR